MATKLNAFAFSSQMFRPGPWDSEASHADTIYSSNFFPLTLLSDSELFIGYENVLRDIRQVLKESMGLDISIYKQDIVQGHIKRRMLMHKFERIADYLDYLQEHTDEIQALYQDILIKVTSFFRDREFFDGLMDDLFPKISQGRRSDDPIRIWVAGCATGEEVYSLAISLNEYLKKIKSEAHFQVFASDIDELALQKARIGIYSRASIGTIPVAERERYFVRVEEGYQIVKCLREACHFIRHNVVDKLPVSGLDLISCRNLLIYLDQKIQQKVISQFHEALNSTGFILLGSSETVGGCADLFRLLGKQGKVYEKKHFQMRVPCL